MIAEDQQTKIDNFHSRVYKLGGGVTSSGELFAMVSLPGILTKFETLDRAIERLNDHIKDAKKRHRVRKA